MPEDQNLPVEMPWWWSEQTVKYAEMEESRPREIIEEPLKTNIGKPNDATMFY